MPEYNDPKYRGGEDYNRPHDNDESQYKDEMETQYAYGSYQADAKKVQQRQAEAQRLREEERELAKAQRLTLIRKSTQTIAYLVVALETLLGLRFILLITGANPENLFANFIYSLSEPLTLQ
ncbi:YggT family protein [Euhalothece natronophila Z-M001]|uniref:YggT family protein n=1 Tax=Euhalothece natronophila Z-M001 TaxID=522448 RepID=A0A5B8NPH1_9CHRO|nr:YggT family protein [Euhalothece natronophila]QDZ40100.1 YggT family protein [Euhalothece natronophila Z-M001]